MANAPDDPSGTPPATKVTVTVADDRLAETATVAEELQAAGMQVDQVLGEVGIITGSVPSGRRSSMEAVPGVAAVEEEATFQLPPPDSEVQ